MGDFTLEIQINQKPAVVFGYIADGTRTPEWYEAIQNTRKLTDGPTGQGTAFEFTRALPGQGSVVNEVEVSEYQAPTAVTFSSVSGPTPFTYRYRVQPEGDRSRVVLEGSITGEGLRGPAALLAPMASKIFERGMGKNLSVLKARLEA